GNLDRLQRSFEKELIKRKIHWTKEHWELMLASQ
ncbi:3-deoxy-D-manno-octulosonic acid kinase, partial [Vibrio anguillarum]|nr:3-deoxy-D-manno-octulosonic acid kinase [Vibrio anguillarum]